MKKRLRIILAAASPKTINISGYVTIYAISMADDTLSFGIIRNFSGFWPSTIV